MQPCSVTCETHDEAVVHCLAALAHFAEHVAIDDTRESLAFVLPAEHGWDREDGRVTFRFSDHRRRGAFLGEATRLLSGKWTRAALHDDEHTRA